MISNGGRSHSPIQGDQKDTVDPSDEIVCSAAFGRTTFNGSVPIGTVIKIIVRYGLNKTVLIEPANASRRIDGAVPKHGIVK